MVWLVTENVRISYKSPEKRDLILKNGEVTVIGYEGDKPETAVYKYAELPLMLQQLMVPMIFSAGSFLQNIQQGYELKPQTTGNKKGQQIYIAESKAKKSISKIEYCLDQKDQTVVYYKIFNVAGGLASEVYFYGYKTYNNKHILPSRIKTMLVMKDGILDEEEIFSRVRVDEPVDPLVFVNK